MNEEIIAELESIIHSCGCELYDIARIKENENDILRISIIAKDGQTTLDKCQLVSENISPFLDVKDIALESYVLEVSSPGIERVLKTPRHFKLSIGEKVHVKLDDKSEFEAIIDSANDKEVGFLLSDEDTKLTKDKKSIPQNIQKKSFAYSQLKKVKTIFDW